MLPCLPIVSALFLALLVYLIGQKQWQTLPSQTAAALAIYSKQHNAKWVKLKRKSRFLEIFIGSEYEAHRIT